MTCGFRTMTGGFRSLIGGFRSTTLDYSVVAGDNAGVCSSMVSIGPGSTSAATCVISAGAGVVSAA